MNKKKKLLGSAVGLIALVCSAGLALALPSGSVTITPAGSTVGGAGPLQPSFNFGPVTTARVDDGAVPPAVPGPVQIGFSNTDTAFAEDKCTMEGSTTQPDAGHGIRWQLILEGRCNVNGFTVNAPGNPDQGSYLTESESTVWARFASTIQGQNPVTRRGNAEVSIANEQAGNLTDNGRVQMGTQAVPFLVTGDRDENFTITLEYGGNAGVKLEALRPEVEVGGLAFAGTFTGSISAWQVAPDGAATLLKQPDGVTDASWEIE